MSDSYTVIIGEGTQEYSFSSTRTGWRPTINNQFNAGGNLDSSEETYEITGRLVGADAAATMTLWKELRAVAQRETEQRFRIYRNAVLEIDIHPSDVRRGPYVLSFDIAPTGGRFSNHVAFVLRVGMTTKGASQFSQNPDVMNLRREIEVEHYDDRLIRKSWRANADGPDAFNLVKSFKPPNVDGLRSIVTERLDDLGATAIYVYEPRRDIKVEETIVVPRGSGRPIVPVLVVPSSADGPENDPILFRGRKRPVELTLTGKITGPDVTAADVPELHYDEEYYDDTRSSYDEEARRVPGDRELFEINYREVYVFPDEVDIGSPDHSSHAGFEDKNEPGDGSIHSA